MAQTELTNQENISENELDSNDQQIKEVTLSSKYRTKPQYFNARYWI